jgi:hypothetical protein
MDFNHSVLGRIDDTKISLEAEVGQHGLMDDDYNRTLFQSHYPIRNLLVGSICVYQRSKNDSGSQRVIEVAASRISATCARRLVCLGIWSLNFRDFVIILGIW